MLAELVKASEAESVARADDLLQEVRALHGKASSILREAEQSGDLKTALLGIREARGCLELLAKLQGQIQDRTTVNILVAPAWAALRSVILRSLIPYPDARAALAAALSEVDNANG